MKTTTMTRALAGVGLATAAATTLPIGPGGAAGAQARADCPNASGYLCFYDYGTTTYGKVAGNNTTWNFGSSNWNNRADWFKNNGVTHDVCVYRNVDYQTGAIHLSRGEVVTGFNNYGESNKWVDPGAACF